MLTFQQKIDVSSKLFNNFDAEPTQVAFFDIETTGLSSEANFIYLICVGYLKNDVPTLLQWFAETPDDEPALIEAFSAFLDDYRVLVHFNGATFDIPFVEKRAEKYKLSCPASLLKSIDLLKLIRAQKNILGLSSCSQKSVERFLGIAREDKYNGGELIEVYQQYLGRSRYDRMKHGTPLSVDHGSGLATMPTTPSEALLYLLLLHNAEDVEGLVKISSLMPLLSVLSGEFPENCIATIEKSEGYFTLTFTPEASFYGVKIDTLLNEEAAIRFKTDGETIKLFVPIFEGELKHYFPNYKDYYYLPEEDYAIFKTAGEGVDKSRRKNATAATCYIKKSGRFLPISATENEPEFKTDIKSKVSYLPFSSLETKADHELMRAVLRIIGICQ